MLLLVYLLPLYLGLSSATTYWVSVETSSLRSSGTDSPVYVRILGEKGAVKGLLQNRGKGDFEAGQVDEFELSLGEVGRIGSVEVSIGGDNMFFFNWVSVRSSSEEKKKYFYNVERRRLSTDYSEGYNKVAIKLQGDATYIVFVETATRKSADSGRIGLSMILEGNNGNRAYTSHLQPKEGVFNQGTVDEFVLRNLPELEAVKCVTLTADGDDAWYFDLIAVLDMGGNVVRYSNKYGKFLSSDSSEGMTSMKLCT